MTQNPTCFGGSICQVPGGRPFLRAKVHPQGRNPEFPISPVADDVSTKQMALAHMRAWFRSWNTERGLFLLFLGVGSWLKMAPKNHGNSGNRGSLNVSATLLSGKLGEFGISSVFLKQRGWDTERVPISSIFTLRSRSTFILDDWTKFEVNISEPHIVSSMQYACYLWDTTTNEQRLSTAFEGAQIFKVQNRFHWQGHQHHWYHFFSTVCFFLCTLKMWKLHLGVLLHPRFLYDLAFWKVPRIRLACYAFTASLPSLFFTGELKAKTTKYSK